MSCKNFITLKNVIGITLTFFCFLSTFSQAQTRFTHGVALEGTTVVWFKPEANITWVDIHFVMDDLQHNFRMVRNFSTGRFEQAISINPDTGIRYSFTYSINGVEAFDTFQFATTTGLSSSSDSSSNVTSSNGFSGIE